MSKPMSKLNPMKCLVLYAMTIVPMGGALSSSALYEPRIGLPTAIIGFIVGCMGAAAFAAILCAYAAGVRYLASNDTK